MDDKGLFYAGKYSEILKKYKGQNLRTLSTESLYWIGRSCYKLKNYESCIKVYNIYKLKDKEKDLLKLYELWSLYNLYIKDNENEEFLKYAVYILNEADVKDKYQLNVYDCTVAKILKHYSKNQGDKTKNINYKEVYKLTELINPDCLSKTETEYEIDGKMEKNVSLLEKWYSLRIRACRELKNYEEGLKLTDEILKLERNGFKLHNNNAIWFRRTKGWCLANLGETEKAVAIYKEIILKFPHYILREDLAEIYKMAGDKENAERYYYEALAAPGQDEMKVNLIERTADLLFETGSKCEAKLNYLYAKNIRENKKWKVENNIIDKLNILADTEISDGEEQIKIKCRKLWNDKYSFYLPKAEGIIEKILPSGKSGFIKTEDGNSIYFRRDSVIKDSKLLENSVGKNVCFSVAEGYDMKKGMKTVQAVQIKIN